MDFQVSNNGATQISFFDWLFETKAYVKTHSECINGFDFKLRNGKLDPALIAKIRCGIENSDVVSDFIKLAFNQ